jgi:hypothetical protein
MRGHIDKFQYTSASSAARRQSSKSACATPCCSVVTLNAPCPLTSIPVEAVEMPVLKSEDQVNDADSSDTDPAAAPAAAPSTPTAGAASTPVGDAGAAFS